MCESTRHGENGLFKSFRQMPRLWLYDSHINRILTVSSRGIQWGAMVSSLSLALALMLFAAHCNVALAEEGESMRDNLEAVPLAGNVIFHSAKASTKIIAKFRHKYGKHKSRLPAPVYAKGTRNKGRVRAGAMALSAPPVLLNNSLDMAAFPSTLARSWVEGSDCIDASWGTYARVAQTDPGGVVNYVMQLEGGTDSAYGCQIINLSQDTPRPVSLGAWVKGENITPLEGTARSGAFIAGYFVFDNGSSVECYNILPNTGTFPWRWVGLNSFSDCQIDRPIAYVALIARLFKSNGTAYFDNLKIEDKELASKPPTGQVSLVFDDGYVSDHAISYPILDSFGIPATSAAISGRVGSNPNVLSYDQIHALVKAGWDVQSHSVTHPRFTSISEAEADVELRDSQTALRKGLAAVAAGRENESFDPTSQVEHFVWPNSALNATMVGLAQTHYQSGRTVYGGLNGYGLYPWVIYSWSVDSTTPLSDIQAWLEDACANRRWLILSAHRIGDPIDGQDNLYVNSADYLTSIAKLIAGQEEHCPTPFEAVNYSTGFRNFATSPSDKPAVP
ncbi:polysaccharide deacetylase family protein [Methylomagnum sp.]